MKKFSFLALTLLFALTGCNLFKGITDFLPPVQVDKTVSIDVDDSITSGDRLENGCIVSVAEESSGNLIIHPAKSPYGQASQNPMLEVAVDNTSSSTVELNGKVSIGVASEPLPKLTAPAGKKSWFLITDGSVDSGNTGAERIAVPGSLKSKFSEGIKEDVVISDLSTATKADVVGVTAKLYFPLAFAPGKTIVIEKSFKDMGIDLSEYGINVSEYEIAVDVTSSMPFSIDISGISSDGVSAALNNPIKPGTKAVPVTTSATANVKSSKALDKLNSATLTFTLKAPDSGAVLLGGEGLQIHYKTVKVKEL